MSDLSLLDGDFPLTAEFLTPIMLEFPQASCPVYHRFGPGLYIRELHMTAGTMAIGHIQKQDHVNILLQGKVMMINEDESTTVVEAPLFFIGKAGSRKIGLVLEDMVWQNIYATEETDIDKLEEMFLEQDQHKTAYVNLIKQHAEETHQYIRDDYVKFLDEIGFTEEQIQAQVQVDDLVDYDAPNQLRVAESLISGLGVLTTAPIAKGSFIAKTRINGRRTPAGRYTNHSPTPNCEMVLFENGDMALRALEDISGCLGGSKGTELTINYRQIAQLNPQLVEGK
jgi:hypothetical protein